MAASMALTNNQRQQYERDGYVILRGFLDEYEPLEKLVEEVATLGRTFSSSFEMADAAWISKMAESDRALLYRALRYLPSLAVLGASERMLSLCKALGLEFPALMRSFNIRMDLPNHDKFLFHWHQDITYLLGSLNSVTFWCPLGVADELHGSIEVVPRSHKQLAPYRLTSDDARRKNAQLSPSDVRLNNEPDTVGPIANVRKGDLVVFSQFLIHRSTPNRSALCRWTVQLRYSDLLEPEFRSAGYPFGDMTTISRVDYLGAHASERESQ